jgi:hypothetical protein
MPDFPQGASSRRAGLADRIVGFPGTIKISSRIWGDKIG